METQNLVQYVLADGSETITTRRGRVIAVRNPNSEYLYLQMRIMPSIQGSVPEPYSGKISRTPKEGEYLLTARLAGFGQRVSNARIMQVNPDFNLK